VLVLRPGALGDTLLAVPALRALRRAYASVTLAAHPATTRLLASVGEVDVGLAFDDPALGWVFSGPPREASVVAWMSDRARGLPADAIVAPSRPPAMDRHCARYLLETLAPLDIDLTWDDCPLTVKAVQSEDILIHPGSGSPHKNWAAGNFARVVHFAKRPVRLIVGEADHHAANGVEDCLGHRIQRLEHQSLEELAARLAGCHAYLGNDSGVSHLAGLCGARSVIMFGPTDQTVWRPIGPSVTVLSFDTGVTEVASKLESD
jgi:ADP-heptose:LPS heptosyltransferase